MYVCERPQAGAGQMMALTEAHRVTPFGRVLRGGTQTDPKAQIYTPIASSIFLKIYTVKITQMYQNA